MSDEVMKWMGLTPEEDAIGDPDDVDTEIDDLLPADLWFAARLVDSRRHAPGGEG